MPKKLGCTCSLLSCYTCRRGRLRKRFIRFCERHFGFTSKRKFGFIHCSWEVIIARRRGTTHSFLDYVVYRLFFVMIICGICVYKTSQSKPLPYLMYFETWVLFLMLVYSLFFLRQVLTHNHHRKALGRKQKMPDQLIIMDEVERDGQTYYITKKISILTRGPLSLYEKFLWILFDLMASMSFVCFIAGVEILGILTPFQEKHLTSHVANNLDAILMAIAVVDICVSAVPSRVGHVIYTFAFLGLYFGFILVHDSQLPKQPLYRKKGNGTVPVPIWIYKLPTVLELLALAVLGHLLAFLLVRFRDWVISLLDKTRSKVSMQRLRTQKRLQRRQQMVPEYNEETGALERIRLDRKAEAPEDYIYWKEEEDELDWAGDSNDSLTSVHESKLLIPTSTNLGAKGTIIGGDQRRGQKKQVGAVITTFQDMVKEALRKARERNKQRFDTTATTDDKPTVKKSDRKLEDIVLPKPPKLYNFLYGDYPPNSPVVPKRVSEPGSAAFRPPPPEEQRVSAATPKVERRSRGHVFGRRNPLLPHAGSSKRVSPHFQGPAFDITIDVPLPHDPVLQKQIRLGLKPTPLEEPRPPKTPPPPPAETSSKFDKLGLRAPRERTPPPTIKYKNLTLAPPTERFKRENIFNDPRPGTPPPRFFLRPQMPPGFLPIFPRPHPPRPLQLRPGPPIDFVVGGGGPRRPPPRPRLGVIPTHKKRKQPPPTNQ